MSSVQDLENQLQPPRQEQITAYMALPAVYADPFSGQPSLDVTMAVIQSLNTRIKVLEQKTLSLKLG